MNKAYRDHMDLIARLYVFCEKIQDIKTKDILLFGMIRESTVLRGCGRYLHPGREHIHLLYNGTMAGDPVRKFLRNVGVWFGHKGWNPEISSYPQGYLTDVLAGMWEHRPKPTIFDMRKKMSDVAKYCEELQAKEGDNK